MTTFTTDTITAFDTATASWQAIQQAAAYVTDKMGVKPVTRKKADLIAHIHAYQADIEQYVEIETVCAEIDAAEALSRDQWIAQATDFEITESDLEAFDTFADEITSDPDPVIECVALATVASVALVSQRETVTSDDPAIVGIAILTVFFLAVALAITVIGTVIVWTARISVALGRIARRVYNTRRVRRLPVAIPRLQAG